MLRQNWFYQNSMTMIGEDRGDRLFYDNNCDAFYLVEEFDEHIRITQITDENAGFQYCMDVLGEYKKNGAAVLFDNDRSLK